MAINSGVPNQEGLSTTYIFTATFPGGTPNPASEAGSAVKVFTPGQASSPGGDAQQAGGTTETLAAAGITVPVEQIVGELHDATDQANGSVNYTPLPLATISAGSPTVGQEPSPAPTVKEFATAENSDGQQPSVTTPFTGTGWSTKSVV